jgi:Lipase
MHRNQPDSPFTATMTADSHLGSRTREIVCASKFPLKYLNTKFKFHVLLPDFLEEEDCNMILVDWSGPGSGPLYNVAKANAEPTGRYIWEMYSYLHSHGLRWQDMHCIGHSLGAHVCGFSGKASSGEYNILYQKIKFHRKNA